MEVKFLIGFFTRILRDPRISATHISVYSVLYTLCLSGGTDTICITSHQVMAMAKISAGNTYHRCIRDLAAFGYIIYEPSYNRFVGSKVKLVEVEGIGDK